MGAANRIILFLKNFSTGIMMPVLSLLLLSRGATLNSLAWIIGIYSLTVVVMEFPSGVFCDLFGRKRTYLISCCLMLLSYVVLFLFPHVAGAVTGFLIQGLARAFSSGSLDALIIEQAIRRDGEAVLAKVNGEFSILESLGIASGSLFGGILAGIGDKYEGNLLCVILLSTVSLILVSICLNETLQPDAGREKNMLTQAAKSISYAWHTPKLKVLMILVFVTGMVLFTIESYWQPAFTALPRSAGSWKLGVITCCGFLFTALGSQMISFLLTRLGEAGEKRWWQSYFLTRILLALCVIFLSAGDNIFSFTLAYGMVYLFLGGSGVAENSLLGRLAPSRLRASIMSLFSLSLQAGALLSSGIAALLVSALELSGLWFLSGCILLCAVLLLSVPLFRRA